VTVRLAKKADLKEELSALIAERTEFVLTEVADALVLEANGVSKHAAHPEDSLNAAWLAFDLLSGVKALCDADRRIMKDSAAAISCPYGGGLGIAHEDEAFGKLTSVCGMTRVEEGFLKINMDIRYGNTFDPKELEKKLHEKWDSIGFDEVDINNRPGYRIPDGNPIPAILCEAFKELTGVESEPKLLSGGTYSRALKNSYSIGFRAPDPDSTVEWPELPAGHGHAHQRDEAIILDQFYQSLRVVTNFVLACDAELSK